MREPLAGEDLEQGDDRLDSVDGEALEHAGRAQHLSLVLLEAVLDGQGLAGGGGFEHLFARRARPASGAERGGAVDGVVVAAARALDDPSRLLFEAVGQLVDGRRGPGRVAGLDADE